MTEDKTTSEKVDNMSWTARAACVGKHELFFSDFKKSVVREAKRICATCPVQAECLEYGLVNVEYGIWGGYTANERKRLRHVRRSSLRIVE